jgi:hypothetical protein
MSEKMTSMLLTLLLSISPFFGFRELWLSEYGLLSSPNARIIIASVSVGLFPRYCPTFDDVLLSDPLRNRIRPDARLQITESKKKISTSIQMCGILYTDFIGSKNMLVLLSTVASRYYNCCTDSSTTPGNYGYILVIRYSTDVAEHCIMRSFVSWTSQI